MDLSKQIEQDLDWRFAELAELKKLTLSVSEKRLPYSAMLRALWVMLYAHYEGFCKFALSIFLEKVEGTNQPRHRFKEELVIFSLERELTDLRRDTSAKSCYRYFNSTFQDVLNSPIKFKRNTKSEFEIKGSSNLYPQHLIEMCECLCISTEMVETNNIHLRALVTRRNEIAHGKVHPIRNIADYRLYEAATTDVMVALAVSVIDTLDSKGYLG